MNVRCLLIVSVMMTLNFLMAGMVLASNNTSGSVDKKVFGDAIYIQHIGESDKPIFPLIIGVTAPRKDEIKLVLGDSQWKWATIIVIPNNVFGDLVLRVEGALAKIEKDTEGGAYGTFKITITGPVGERARIIDSSAAKEIFDAMISVAGKSKKLNDAITNLQRRLP